VSANNIASVSVGDEDMLTNSLRQNVIENSGASQLICFGLYNLVLTINYFMSQTNVKEEKKMLNKIILKRNNAEQALQY
jgi:hypothetical protein